MMNALNWFEIPVADMPRAAKFYGEILGIELLVGPASPGHRMAILPADNGVGGALLSGEGYTPSATGTVVYLNGGDDLTAILDRVEPAGGKVLIPKTSIGGNGFFAFFLDTEGNKVGLHSMR